MGPSEYKILGTIAMISVISFVAQVANVIAVDHATIIGEFISKAPFLAAIVAVVWMFLKAQRSMTTDFKEVTSHSSKVIGEIAGRIETLHGTAITALQENTKAMTRLESAFEKRRDPHE